MRVSTLQINNTMQYNLNTTASAMNKTLIQMSTHKNLLAPSDDVLASTQIFGMTDESAQLEAYANSIKSAENALTQTETVVSDMVNIMNNMRDLVLAVGNPATGEGESAYLQEIEQLTEALVDVANSQSASDEFIFGGTKGDTEPVTGDADSGYTVGGSSDPREIQVSDSQSVEAGVVAGDLFNLDSGDNIFNVMTDFVQTASDPNTTPDQMEQLIEDTIIAIDETLENMNKALTDIGGNINTLDMVADSNAEMQLYNDAMLSSLEDLDYGQATMEFSMLQIQQQATQSAYAMVTATSLFDYL